MSSIEKSLKFKDEGNTLFVKKQYADAYKKYTAAIQEDGDNAVFYANRAACSLNMKKYLDAVSDATKATDLDSMYSKAWARRATGEQGLGSWDRAVDSWKKAVASLPIENLSASDLKQKEQYETGLKEAREYLRTFTERNGESLHVLKAKDVKTGNMPWERAAAMYPALQQQRMAKVASSAWVIHGAYEEFSEGVNLMKQTTNVKRSGGPEMMVGRTGVLSAITNGILRDKRVFHIDDPKWISNYNKQVFFEAQRHNAWTEAGPERVLQEAQTRLLVGGWDNVRPALSVTVRAWIMRAFMSGGASQNHGAAIQWYGHAIEVLERGRKLWHDVHKDDRGAIFERTFIRGIRVLQLDELMQAYAKSPGPNSQYPLEKTLELADNLIAECEVYIPSKDTEYDPGFISSFFVYPAGAALAIKGFCHRYMARFEYNNPTDVKESLMKSAKYYLEAAAKYPDDDEQHCWYLNSALGSMWRTGAPPKVTLPIIAQIRESIPKMKTIWEHSTLAREGRDKILRITLEFEEDVLKSIKEGKITEIDPVVPESQCNPKK